MQQAKRHAMNGYAWYQRQKPINQGRIQCGLLCGLLSALFWPNGSNQSPQKMYENLANYGKVVEMQLDQQRAEQDQSLANQMASLSEQERQIAEQYSKLQVLEEKIQSERSLLKKDQKEHIALVQAFQQEKDLHAEHVAKQASDNTKEDEVVVVAEDEDRETAASKYASAFLTADQAMSMPRHSWPQPTQQEMVVPDHSYNEQADAEMRAYRNQMQSHFGALGGQFR